MNHLTTDCPTDIVNTDFCATDRNEIMEYSFSLIGKDDSPTPACKRTRTRLLPTDTIRETFCKCSIFLVTTQSNTHSQQIFSSRKKVFIKLGWIHPDESPSQGIFGRVMQNVTLANAGGVLDKPKIRHANFPRVSRQRISRVCIVAFQTFPKLPGDIVVFNTGAPVNFNCKQFPIMASE